MEAEPNQAAASTWVPKSWSDVRKLSMDELRSLCKAMGIPHPGRVTKEDLCQVVCQRFRISTSGGAEGGPSLEKPAIDDPNVREAYRKLPSFSRITSGWSVPSLCKVPFFDLASVKDYLINSPDKAFDGQSLRCYKQLRAFQLFDERHVHALEANLWNKGDHFYLVRAKCWPSQDTSKAAYKCIVCIDRQEGRCYGAHCRCVSGLGEACSHIAALLFALEDFLFAWCESTEWPCCHENDLPVVPALCSESGSCPSIPSEHCEGWKWWPKEKALDKKRIELIRPTPSRRQNS